METIYSKIGGRKFIMAVISIIAGALIEIYGKNGLGVNMVALLGTIYGTFSVSNTMITNKAAGKLASTDSTPPTSQSDEVVTLLNSNNAQLSTILNQVAIELGKQQEVNQSILNALNGIQLSQSSIQKVVGALATRNGG